MSFESPRSDRLAAAPSESLNLIDHVQQCAFARSPLHGLQCAVESLGAFLAPRVVTTLTILTLAALTVLSLRG